jgi:hypothetical protein
MSIPLPRTGRARCHWTWRRVLALPAATLALACASQQRVTVTAVPAGSVDAVLTASAWPVRVREHVDLWLHGFAILQPDSSLVPYYRPGYDAALRAVRTRLGVNSLLDANRERLRSGLAANPRLLSSQFLALYFPTWDALRVGASLFLSTSGNARAAHDRASASTIATFATYFPSRADRDWLRLYVASLEDEREKFFASYWTQEQKARSDVLAAIDGEWRTRDLERLSPFLYHTRQRTGELILALPLGGEGRTLTRPGERTMVAVGFPTDAGSAGEAIDVFAHEIVGTVASAVVTDNSTPAERRGGEADRDASLAAVRGGAMLLGRVLPERRDAYMRYYLSLAQVTPPATGIEETFSRTFPLSDRLRDALQRQIDIILGGT